MDLWTELLRYFQDTGSTRRVVMLGCTLLGISSGVLGTFALLRRQSLLGDAMAHAALPGVCMAFLLTRTKHPLLFLVGALISGLIGAFFITQITRHSRIKSDTAIGLILSVFFGFGIVLLTLIQQSGAGNQAGLDTFLFGKAAFLLHSDIYIIAGMCCLLIVFVSLFFKEFKVLSFDPAFGASIGLPIPKLDFFLTGLVVVAVMIGLQAVGVVLMAAMLIIPAASARQWTDNLGTMTLLAAFSGGFAGALGALASTLWPKMPTGPVMVLAASSLLMLSLLFAPKRGLLPAWLRQRRNQRRIQQENILKAFYKFAEQQEDFALLISFKQLRKRLQWPAHELQRHCAILTTRQLLTQHDTGWSLTGAGLQEAKRIVRNHRLWELYLTQKANIASDHVHRDAEDMEHILSDEIVAQLEELLQKPDTDPHGKPIPGRPTHNP